MAQPTIQTSFASGEWAPKLRSRVDIQKYRSGAALLRNFYVDYSGGGASTRPGTRYINNCRFYGGNPTRLIPFQPSANLSYVLEFGTGYIRFFSNGGAVLEPAIPLTSITGNHVVAPNSYVAGDWVLIGNAYYIITSATAADFFVEDLYGNPSVFPNGSAAARIYTLSSPYAGSDLFPNPITGNPGIKYVQNVTSMIITHPNYPVYVLTINSAANWTIVPANFGATIASPATPTFATTLAILASGWQYAYTVTAVDINGQESTAPIPVQSPTGASALKSLSDSTSPGTNTITWAAVPGAQSYNVYKASPIFGSGVVFPANIPVGFIANVTATSFDDPTPGIAPDFAQTPPIGQNPFQGAAVQSYTVTASGAPYTVVPTVTVSAPPAGGYQAAATASLGVTVATLNSHGAGGIDISTSTSASPQGFSLTFHNGVSLVMTSVSLFSTSPGVWNWDVNAVSISNPGSIISGSTPTNPVAPIACSAPNLFAGGLNPGFNYNLTWGVIQVIPTQPGAGYTSAPSVTFSPVGASATANLGSASSGNPGVAGFIQERLVLAGQQRAVQSINMSQPGSFFNFNTTFPTEADDAISTQIISSELNDIRSLTQVPTGLLALTGRASWLINGGGGISTQDPITPANITAQPQGYNGANALNPLKINNDILYGTKKGNYVRDLTYNIWTQLFGSVDISV